MKLISRSIDLEGILVGTLVEERPFMFDVDRVKAFKKLARKQFKNPHLGLREIVSNALDSYAGQNKQKEVNISLDRDHFEVIDYGSGFTEEKIECLRTLGQSDKRGNVGYIGRFGIGFASLFNPDLKVKKVTVDTKVNDKPVRLQFTVEPTGVTLKRYDINESLPFSTRIRAEFDNLDYRTIEGMEKTLKEEAKYMNSDITLNGININGKAFFERTRKYMLDFEGELSGRICFYNPEDESEKSTASKIALLSHNVYVDTAWDHIFCMGKNDFRFPSFFGFVNSDNLNVITSRNDFKKDEKYTAFRRNVRKQIRKKFRDLCTLVAENSDPELRDILMNAFEENSRPLLLGEYSPEKVKDACAKALSDAPIFTAINIPGKFSLKQIYEIAKKQGHLLIAENPEAAELLDIQGYDAPIIKSKCRNYITLEGIPTFSLDSLYSFGGQLDENMYKELVDKGILIPEKLRTEVKEIKDEDLNENEKNFIVGLRKILTSEKTKKILEKAGLDTQYPVHIADVSPLGVVACYDTLAKRIAVNRKNFLTVQYIKDNGGNNSYFFLPVLAHELSHNIVGRHDNPFYELSSELSSKLAVAITDDLTENK